MKALRKKECKEVRKSRREGQIEINIKFGSKKNLPDIKMSSFEIVSMIITYRSNRHKSNKLIFYMFEPIIKSTTYC
ncbi:CLUMA_CG006382, isoform A [Clunio marinus]|uniref:CLUMA_CG006382, isoform A n=1 Tax=Clunio marinus TaxID=568069 RepID=A0A1J1HZV5_9DIPT|nr:CLUMA_CG006382, isoform A [Clunio marinus]